MLAPMDPGQAAACRANARRLVLLAAMLLVLAWAARRHAPAVVERQPSRDSRELAERLDPNSAPWWELAALPHVGESLARRIVEARSARGNADAGDGTPAFATLDDLRSVRGIGPATLSRMRPFLAIMPVHAAHRDH